jgi:subtilase family serine protease
MSVNEDLAYVGWMDEQFGSEQIDAMVEEAYQTWASDRREDGEDDSRDAYTDYLERGLPDD